MSGVYDRLQADAASKSHTITVTFFRHAVRGDLGKTYLWNISREFTNWKQLLQTLAHDIHGPTGPSQRVYDLQGKQLTELSELQNGGVYVCCGGEQFTIAGVPVAAWGDSVPPEAAAGGAVHGTEPSAELAKMIDEDISKHKTKECWFHPAVGQCVKTAKGVKLIINPTRYRTVDQLLGEVRGKVVLVTGPIQKLYDLEGNELTAIADLKDHAHYICSIARAFNKSMIPAEIAPAS